MALQTFNFPAHRVSFKYLPNDVTIQFGDGWEFTSKGRAPLRRQYTLKFTIMKWYFFPDGEIDLTKGTDEDELKINLGLLDKFYQDHGRHTSFKYEMGPFGSKICRFATELEIPEGIPGGDGAVPAFDVKLNEVSA